MNLKDVPLALLLVAFFVAFAGLWCFICLLISTLSGWRLLAGIHRCAAPVEGKRWRFQSAGMHRFRLMPANYGGCLTVIANDEGIGLSVLWPFRLGHPPLFIPWSEMNLSQVNWLYLFPLVRCDFVQEPSVALFIEPKLARRIQEAIGRCWFQEIG
jgi:hypothetical protein